MIGAGFLILVLGLGALSLALALWLWLRLEAPASGHRPLLIAALLLLLPLRAWLHTGLFIGAHDAMHGSLFPLQRHWNRMAGSLLLLLYAGLPYRRCCRLHRRHHRHCGQAGDPDHWPEPGAGRSPVKCLVPFRSLHWYASFMGRYLGRAQLIGIALFYGAVAAVLWHWTPLGPVGSLLAPLSHWLLPLVLSSAQLFVVGTYLPHRRSPVVASLNWPGWLSLLACYHFGHHRAHHEQPWLPWYALPATDRSTAINNEMFLALPTRSRLPGPLSIK
ncbi:beta-carotene ketolase [Synechococcus sp. RSCCF101]|uniref:fatty acid desaturase n=1 Tax=Synechococcus sp. RSCCF101 TaxID=2511069 RepID=UPI001247BB59|nr:fatty acid desaturase [Synechococcus sp. RSCCF101]QEY31215.1 beta-carotene ketolase [Synechococcus sp. RSCCF101]